MAKKQDTEEQGPNVFPKKWDKLLSSEFKESAESYSTDEIKKKICVWEQAISQTEKDQNNDLELKVLNEKASELKKEIKEKADVYNESILSTQSQIRFVVWILNNRGVELK